MSAAEEETVAAQRARAAVATERVGLIYGPDIAELIATWLEDGISDPDNTPWPDPYTLGHLVGDFAWFGKPWPSFKKLACSGEWCITVRLHAAKCSPLHSRAWSREHALTIGDWSIASHALTASPQWKLCVQEVVRQLGAILPPVLLEWVLQLAQFPPPGGWSLPFRCFMFDRELPILSQPLLLSHREALLRGLCVWCQQHRRPKGCSFKCCFTCCPGACFRHRKP